MSEAYAERTEPKVELEEKAVREEDVEKEPDVKGQRGEDKAEEEVKGGNEGDQPSDQGSKSANIISEAHAEPTEPKVELEGKVVTEENVEKEPDVMGEKGEDKGEEEVKGSNEGDQPSGALTETTDTTSFKEESYKVGDLKEFEKKALEEFRLKLEEALKLKTFFKKDTKAALALAAGVEEEKKGKEVEHKEEEDKGGKEGKKEEEKDEKGSELKKEELEKNEVKEELKEGATADEVVPPKNEEEVKEKLESEVVEREVVVEGPPTPVVEAPKEFYLWDVPIHEAGDERTDVVLLKFLRARDFKVEEAFSMLKGTLAWRRDFGLDKKISPVEGAVTEESVKSDAAAPAGVEEGEGAKEVKEAEELAFFESVAYMHGVGKEGHPVCYDEYGALQSKEFYGDDAKVERFFKWRIEMLERSIKSHLEFSPGGIHSMIQVVDLEHNPFFFKGRHITKKALALLQDNYPELVSKQIILNIPWYSFVTWYTAFGRVFTPRMKRKLVLVKPGKTAETLFKFIPPEQVPVKYGGLSRVGDTEFEGVEAPISELVIKPGAKHTIEFSIEEAGTTLVWDVNVVGWDVVYGEEFCPSDERSYLIVIHKPKKLSPGAEAIRNSFKANEPGKIVITIDNTLGKKKKLILSRSTIKKT